MFIYCIRVRVPGEEEDVDMEIAAPDLATALMVLAAEFPGIHIIKYVGSYLPGMGGTA